MISSICACFWFSLAAVVVVPYIAGRPRLLHQSKNFLRLGMFLLFSSFFFFGWFLNGAKLFGFVVAAAAEQLINFRCNQRRCTATALNGNATTLECGTSDISAQSIRHFAMAFYLIKRDLLLFLGIFRIGILLSLWVECDCDFAELVLRRWRSSSTALTGLGRWIS